MKIIELLTKIANGENLPNKVKLECVNSINEHNCFYEFNPIAETYVNGDNQLIQNATCFATLLNLEVEIIEEDKKIEKLETYDIAGNIFLEDYCFKYIPIDKKKLTANEQVFVNKIDEIIDYINGGTNE